MIGISGLVYLPDYISPPHHDWLIEQIDNQPWDTAMKRRVQHYGYRYDYKARTVNPDPPAPYPGTERSVTFESGQCRAAPLQTAGFYRLAPPPVCLS